MRVRWHKKEEPGRFIYWLATQIRDPILKLRFLRRFAPRPQPRRTPRAGQVLLQIVPSILVATTVTVLLTRTPARVSSAPAVPLTPPAQVVHAADGLQAVWRVERQAGFETWSNGLRIDDRFRVDSRPRAYTAFRISDSGDTNGVRRSDPAGIVFHTTESQQVPFVAVQSDHLRRIGESLVEYVQRRRSYNFLIDRFGRVYRIVAEEQAANHAGYSAWSDENWLYLNLNDSFLGVSFEAETEPGQTQAAITQAQVRAAGMLIEMLRSRYGIPAGNCVTHGQVSVNPDNMRIGYHTDWASAFPFEQVGLPENYTRPLPALWALGFEYDSTFLNAAGERMTEAIEASDRMLMGRAARLSVTPAEYRRMLQRGYRAKLAALRQSGTESE